VTSTTSCIIGMIAQTVSVRPFAVLFFDNLAISKRSSLDE